MARAFTDAVLPDCQNRNGDGLPKKAIKYLRPYCMEMAYGVKLPYTIKKIRRLQDGSEIKPHEAFNTEGFPDYVFFELVDWSYNPLSDPFDTVVEFEVE